MISIIQLNGVYLHNLPILRLHRLLNLHERYDKVICKYSNGRWTYKDIKHDCKLIVLDKIKLSTELNARDGDFIVFEYFGEVYVTDITVKSGDYFIVHFLEGYKSQSERILPEEILGIGSKIGKYKINGWGGKYVMLNDKLKDYENRRFR